MREVIRLRITLAGSSQTHGVRRDTRPQLSAASKRVLEALRARHSPGPHPHGLHAPMQRVAAPTARCGALVQRAGQRVAAARAPACRRRSVAVRAAAEMPEGDPEVSDARGAIAIGLKYSAAGNWAQAQVSSVAELRTLSPAFGACPCFNCPTLCSAGVLGACPGAAGHRAQAVRGEGDAMPQLRVLPSARPTAACPCLLLLFSSCLAGIATSRRR